MRFMFSHPTALTWPRTINTAYKEMLKCILKWFRKQSHCFIVQEWSILHISRTSSMLLFFKAYMFRIQENLINYFYKGPGYDLNMHKSKPYFYACQTHTENYKINKLHGMQSFKNTETWQNKYILKVSRKFISKKCGRWYLKKISQFTSSQDHYISERNFTTDRK